MPDPNAPGDHVTDQLFPLFTGALGVTESDLVDRHLRACADCAAEAVEVREVIAALALLVDDTVPAAEPRPPVPARPARRVNGHDWSRAARPGGRKASSRPAGPVSGRRRRIALTRAALALAALLFVGFGTLFVVSRTTTDATAPPVTVAATSTATGTGASATVQAWQAKSGSELRLTVTGLRADRTYRVNVLTLGGQTHDIGGLTGQANVEDSLWFAPVDLNDLAFVTIGPAGGPPTVSVHLPGVPASAPR